MRRLVFVLLACSSGIGGVPAVLTQSQDACAAALGQPLGRMLRSPLDRAQKYGRLGNDARDIRDLLHASAAAAARRPRGRWPIATRTTSRFSKTTAAT